MLDLKEDHTPSYDPVAWAPKISATKNNNKLDDYIGTDTKKGCSHGCIGCFAGKMSAISKKDFSDVIDVKMVGKLSPNYFFWTRLTNPVPIELRDKHFNVTLDTFREDDIKKQIQNIQMLDPKKVLLAFRQYPGNAENERRNRALADDLAKLGYKRKFHLVVRLSKKQAQQVPFGGCDHVWFSHNKEDKKPWYAKHSLKNFGVSCGSIGGGTCKDCNLCFKPIGADTRIGTMSDPELGQWENTLKILREQKLI